MRDLDFFVNLVITGTVLGLDHTSDLAEVEAVFPDGTNPIGDSLLTSVGLVEFGWYRADPRDRWQVAYFGVQAHRLGVKVRTPALTDHYGRFRRHLDYDQLRRGVEMSGFDLELQHDYQDGHGHYWLPSTGVGVTYIADESEARKNAPVGTVLKILGVGGPTTVGEGDPDEVVGRWLATTADRYPLAVRLATESPRYPDEIRLCRQLRDDLHALEPRLLHVTDPLAADELRRWLDLRPRLLRQDVVRPGSLRGA
ncbi:hypothetical protein GCM10029964_021960 [Kibdelosporangium lantanae]